MRSGHEGRNARIWRHAGTGRILQYDNDLNLKGVLWVEGTTHKIGGLNFAPDGVLWAMAHRGQLVRALLVLIRAWISAGRPRGQTRLGSFEP